MNYLQLQVGHHQHKKMTVFKSACTKGIPACCKRSFRLFYYCILEHFRSAFVQFVRAERLKIKHAAVISLLCKQIFVLFLT